MGRPIKDKFFGDPASVTTALYMWADVGNGLEKCWIVKQTGSRTFKAESDASGTRMKVKLVNGPSAVTGPGLGYIEAAGTGQLVEADSATVTARGSNYSKANTVTVDMTGTDSVYAIASVASVAAQDETSYTGVGARGTFVGGTDFEVADTITMSDGTVITVDGVDAGVVDEFTVTTGGTTGHTANGAALTQVSTSGIGVDFTLTLGVINQGVFAVTINTAGTSTAPGPSNPTATTSNGSGTGATLTVVYSSVSNDYVSKISNKNLITFDANASKDDFTVSNGLVNN